MILSSVFYIKNIKFDKIEKEQKILLITLVGIVILGLFSDGGIKSAEISLKKSYRYLPIFFAPIFLNNMQKIKKFMFFISCSVIVSFINGMNLYRLKDWNFNIRYESFTRINDTPHMLTALSFIILGYLLYLYHKKNGKKMIYFSLIYINANSYFIESNKRIMVSIINGDGSFWNNIRLEEIFYNYWNFRIFNDSYK